MFRGFRSSLTILIQLGNSWLVYSPRSSVCVRKNYLTEAKNAIKSLRGLIADHNHAPESQWIKLFLFFTNKDFPKWLHTIFSLGYEDLFQSGNTPSLPSTHYRNSFALRCEFFSLTIALCYKKWMLIRGSTTRCIDCHCGYAVWAQSIRFSYMCKKFLLV